MNKFMLMLLIIYLLVNQLESKVIEICPVCTIRNIDEAKQIVQPGDTIMFREGIYTASNFVSSLQGTSEKWITITANPNEEVIFRGQSTAIHLSDPAYILISNLKFEGQTANGVNIDDGGTFETPAHDIIIENCEWRSMNATGNNDMLKMSGVDNFIIRNCRFSNGSPGGSGIDMVGCHDGVIENCIFFNQGSNSIQTKGGSSQITIQKNKFVNGGLRSLNIGGSTGPAYFRPIDAKYEAKEINVYSNIFIGSQSPIAFVGAINCSVINNTIYLPSKWAIRILQENTSEGFLKCGFNSFINNIVYVNNSSANPTINIGPNTEPETFYFSNNLWFNQDNLNWPGPNLPVTEPNSYKNLDPMISLNNQGELIIDKSSPVKGLGLDVPNPKEDIDGNLFNSPRSIGAKELNPKISTIEDITFDRTIISPNPASDFLILNFEQSNRENSLHRIKIYNIYGSCEIDLVFQVGLNYQIIDISSLASGIYFIIISNYIERFLVIK